MSAIRPPCRGSRPCRSASFSRYVGRHARAASRQASSLELRGRAPLRPSQIAEQQHHPLDVRGGQRRAHPVERVRESVGKPALAQEADELVDRRPERLEVAVILLAQVPDEDVQRDVVLGEAGRHLDGEERAGQIRDPERPLERVVVADRDERHPAPAADVVDALQAAV